MLILLPPSEGKTSAASRRAPVRLDSLSFPELTETRARVLETLVELCRTDPSAAAAALGLGPTQLDEVARDARLFEAPALPAIEVYTGVLYDALDPATWTSGSRRRATSSLVIVSGLWGALRPADRVPPYRLSMSATLPGLGPLPRLWRAPLADALRPQAARGLVVDCRSSDYVAAWPVPPDLAGRWVQVHVVREQAGRRQVVSHMAKHGRGLLARELLRSASPPRRPEELAELVGATGRWAADLHQPPRPGQPWRLELVEPA
ncbi:MAG: YaaA family protein [Actinomycetales bacterium]